MRPHRLRLGAAALLAAVAATAASAALAAGAAAAADASDAGPAPAHGASHLAGMRLDGLTAQGHAVVIEFAAQGGGGAADGEGRAAQPGRLALAGGMVWTESGPRPLGGDDAQVMVTGGGTVAVRSSDRPAVLFAVPEAAGAGGGGAAARYTVTAYVPLDGGGLESASFDATLGPSGRGAAADGGVEEAAPAPAGQPGGAEGSGRFPDRLAIAVTVTERVQYGGTLVVQGRVYDADANAAPAVVPRGPGAVPGAPVQVTATDRRTGEAVLDWDGEADESGLFRAEHRWGSADPASTLDIAINVDGGRAVEERTAFYLGFQDYRPRDR